MTFQHLSIPFLHILIFGLALLGCSETTSQATVDDPLSERSSILVFTKTEGFRHQSIPDGIDAIRQLATENGIEFTHTEDGTYFQTDSLTKFDAVIFLSTTGDILNDEQQLTFQQFIQSGGGFIGIHSATDTEYEWPWYGKMVGAYFESHPQVQEAKINVIESDHPATSFLSNEWVRTDEWYNFRDINSSINVLLSVDETSYNGGENGNPHPVAWYHEFDGGRVFYTAGGHTSESYTESLFRQHLLGGIQYVINK